MQRCSRWFGFVLALCGGGALAGVDGAERIYRCGNEYTNLPANPQACQLLPQQTLTVIPGTRPLGAPVAPAPQGGARTKVESPSAPNAPNASNAPAWVPGVSAAVDAKTRDAQQRTILLAELRQTRERHAQLVLEYNAGEPDKVGGEARNHQKYLDRLAGLKAGIARAERDMDSLQRELSKWPSAQVAQP